MDDPILIFSCISNEQEEIQVSMEDFCVFLFRSDELKVRVAHLAMTEEFVESCKYIFPNNSNILKCISVEFKKQIALEESNKNIWAI